MSENVPDAQKLGALVSRYRRVAIFLFAVAVFYLGLCMLVIYKASMAASMTHHSIGALAGEWMARIDVNRQYPGSIVLVFDLLSMLVRNIVICACLALFSWLMWKWARFYEALKIALLATVAEAPGQAAPASAQQAEEAQ